MYRLDIDRRRPARRPVGGLEAAIAAAAAAAVVPRVAGVSGAAAVGEAVPPLREVEAVHGPAGWSVLAAVRGSLPGDVACSLGGAGEVFSCGGGAWPLPASCCWSCCRRGWAWAPGSPGNPWRSSYKR